jgi:uncharacterized membrane protein YfcA
VSPTSLGCAACRLARSCLVLRSLVKPGLLALIGFGVVGFIAQAVDGTLGMGYGVFSTALLVGFGLAPAIASASVHTAETVTTLVSGISHWRLGNVRWNLFIPLAATGAAGGVAGAYLLASVPGQTMKPAVSAILLVMGALVLYRFLRRRDAEPEAGKPTPLWQASLLGLAAGFLDAVGGGGWGPLATPTLILKGDHEPRQVVGTVNLVEFVVTLAETITFLLTIGPENFEWGIVGALVVGGVIAAPMAAWLCRKMPHRALGIAIGVLLVLLNLRTLILALS